MHEEFDNGRKVFIKSSEFWDPLRNQEIMLAAIDRARSMVYNTNNRGG